MRYHLRWEVSHDSNCTRKREFQFNTLSNHPVLCKAVDDLICDYYGEENPSIQQDYELMGGMTL